MTIVKDVEVLRRLMFIFADRRCLENLHRLAEFIDYLAYSADDEISDSEEDPDDDVPGCFFRPRWEIIVKILNLRIFVSDCTLEPWANYSTAEKREEMLEYAEEMHYYVDNVFCKRSYTRLIAYLTYYI